MLRFVELKSSVSTVDTVVFKRMRRYSLQYTEHNSKRYDIDTFCEKNEYCFCLYTKAYSDLIVEYMNEKYGKYISITNEVASKSQLSYDFFSNDDDDDDYCETDAVYFFVIHVYKMSLKEGVEKNVLKLKFPELSDFGLFSETPLSDTNYKKREGWVDEYIKQAKRDIKDDEEGIMRACRKAAGL